MFRPGRGMFSMHPPPNSLATPGPSLMCSPFYLTASQGLCLLPVGHAANGGEVLQLNDANFHEQVNQHDVVIVNFYADWCRFCQMLKPVYAQAAKKIGEHPRVRPPASPPAAHSLVGSPADMLASVVLPTAVSC